MIYDVITYNGEKELFDLRYNILKDYVDEFIVVEFDQTFSGKGKPWYGDKDIVPFIKNELPHVEYWQLSEYDYKKYKDLALSSPNTNYGKGAEHWIREFCQKESIKDCLTHLNDDDLVFISDCDEIYDPAYATPTKFLQPFKLKLRVYAYWLNNRSSEEFYGTLVGNWGAIKGRCLNHLRTDALKKAENYKGWHFTSLKDNLRQKLLDSYTEETYATQAVLDNLEKNIDSNRDFLGRDFTYQIDESDWPDYLKENREKYKHLCR